TLSIALGHNGSVTAPPLGQQVLEESADGTVSVVNVDDTQEIWGTAGSNWHAAVGTSKSNGQSEILWEAPTTGVYASYYLWTAGANGGSATQTTISLASQRGTSADWIGSGDLRASQRSHTRQKGAVLDRLSTMRLGSLLSSVAVGCLAALVLIATFVQG